MKPFITLIIIILSVQPARALNIKIVESTSASSGHTMDSRWLNIATIMGHTGTINPQTMLDNALFFPTTDILIVSSGVIALTPARVSTIQAFLQTGKPVYLQSEYLATYTTNQAFAQIVNALGGTFAWTGTTSGQLTPMQVLGNFATTNLAVTPLSYFWYGCHGTGSTNVIPFLLHNNLNYGYIFCPPSLSIGKIVTVSDQDWILNNASPALMQNIITAMISSSVCPTAVGPNITPGLVTNVKCSGGNTGSATVTASSGTPPYTYLWAPAGGTASTAVGLTAGTYTCTVTDANNLTATTTIVITQPPVIAATSVVTHVGCPGGNDGSALITATGGTPPYTFQWTPGSSVSPIAGNLAAGMYTCTVRDVNNCLLNKAVTIGEPHITLQPRDTTVCDSADAGFSIQVDSPGMSYQWQVNKNDGSGFINIVAGPGYVGEQSAQLGILNAVAAMHGFQYRCLVGSTCTASSDSATLFVGTESDPRMVKLYSYPGFPICEGNDMSFRATLLPDYLSPIFFDWYINGKKVETNKTNYTAKGLKNGDVVMCVAQAKDPCNNIIELSATDTARVFPLPPAKISLTGGDLCLRGTADVTTPLTEASYRWLPQDQFSNEALNNGTIALNDPITRIQVVVTSRQNCVAVDSLTINAEECCKVAVANAFTPNNDGLNDVCRVLYQKSAQVNLFRIYNRWGQLLFQTSDNNGAWDGSFHGRPADLGTYFYYIDYNCDGSVERKIAKGEVILVR